MKKLLIVFFALVPLLATELPSPNPDSLHQHFHQLDSTSYKAIKIIPVKETDPLKMLGKGLFWIYSRFITTQDNHECQFEPSCSKYAKDAMSKRHIVEAILLTSDRVVRCNPTAFRHYESDSLGFLIDTLEFR